MAAQLGKGEEIVHPKLLVRDASDGFHEVEKPTSQTLDGLK